MRIEERLRVDVILNEGSGAVEKTSAADRIAAFCAGRAWDVRIARARSGEELSAAASRAASGEAEIVVAGGGGSRRRRGVAAIESGGPESLKAAFVPCGYSCSA